MKPSEDQVHIDQVRDGQLASFAYLVDKYKNMAYTVALRVLRDVHEAEDAAQESFIKAYQQLHTFEGNAKFSTWLYTIVYRTSLNKLQKRQKVSFSMEDGINEKYTSDFSVPPLEAIQSIEKQKFIREAIGKLPHLEELLITLYYLNENSIREIEEITGLSESNIKVRLHRARKLLEEQLRFLL